MTRARVLSRSLGVAYYDATSDTIWYTSQDVWGVGDLEWSLQCLFHQVCRPTVVLTRCDETR